jgi:hypothetical protein
MVTSNTWRQVLQHVPATLFGQWGLNATKINSQAC